MSNVTVLFKRELKCFKCHIILKSYYISILDFRHGSVVTTEIICCPGKCFAYVFNFYKKTGFILLQLDKNEKVETWFIS
jgi:hypothetical protein